MLPEAPIVTAGMVNEAVERYREVAAAGLRHWPAVKLAAREHCLNHVRLHLAVQMAEGRAAGPGAGR